MMKFPLPVRLRHWFIISRWQKWLFPLVCCIPYLAILGWLLMRGLIWVAHAWHLCLWVPCLVSLWLARQEFRTQLPGRKIKSSIE